MSEHSFSRDGLHVTIVSVMMVSEQLHIQRACVGTVFCVVKAIVFY